MVAEVTIQMALVPAGYLAWRRSRGERFDAALWWIAAALSVSWIADRVSAFFAPHDRWIISTTYPVSQTALIGVALLERKRAAILAGVLAVAAAGVVVWRGVHEPDVIFRSGAWITILWLLWTRLDAMPVRWSMSVYFGGGLIAWLCYARWPGLSTWAVYQGMRALGLAWFCVAANANARPGLQLVRR